MRSHDFLDSVFKDDVAPMLHASTLHSSRKNRSFHSQANQGSMEDMGEEKTVIQQASDQLLTKEAMSMRMRQLNSIIRRRSEKATKPEIPDP